MNKVLFSLIFLVCFINLKAQDVKELQETARGFMKQQDFSNAVLVLNRALQMEPGNLAVAKDLALGYYYQNDLQKALEIMKPLIEKDEADDQSFQVTGNIYKALGNPKEAEKIYKKGLKKFPASGPLYNDFGELKWSQKDYSAIEQWEKGIQSDPAYSRNFYNAARYYYFTTDRIWSILYGEIFLNMEPFSSTTPEIKELLLESYKKLYTETTQPAKNKTYAHFEKAYLEIMHLQSPVASTGINAESLTMIRTRFILEWQEKYAEKYPFFLFDHHKQLLQLGIFVAYNQWIFGSSQNLSAFQNWITSHPEEYTEFTRFQRARVFKMPPGQYYK